MALEPSHSFLISLEHSSCFPWPFSISIELLQLPAGPVPHSLAPSPWRVSPGKLPGQMEPQGLGRELPFQLESLEMPAGVCILMTRGFCSHCGPFVPHKAAPGAGIGPGGASTAHLMHSGLRQC